MQCFARASNLALIVFLSLTGIGHLDISRNRLPSHCQQNVRPFRHLTFLQRMLIANNGDSNLKLFDQKNSWPPNRTNLFNNGSFPASFSIFRLFNAFDSKQMLNINFADDWIWTTDLCIWKQPLYHCPIANFLSSIHSVSFRMDHYCCCGSSTVWPDVKIKRCQTFSKVAKKVPKAAFS